MHWKYLGGDKRCNGRFGYMDGPYFKIGLRHRPMTNINRARFLNCSMDRERRGN
jgi:hypothetical protein